MHAFVSFRKRYITGSFLALPRAVVSLCLWRMPGTNAPERGRTRSWHPPQVALSCSMCKNRPVAGPSSNKEEARSTMALTVPASWGASGVSRPIRYGLISLRFHKSRWGAVVAQRPEGRRENRACDACSGILIYRHSIQRSWAVASLRLLRAAPTRSPADQVM